MATTMNVDESAVILFEVLNELMIGFDSEDDKTDFIIDVVEGYKKKLSEKYGPQEDGHS